MPTLTLPLLEVFCSQTRSCIHFDPVALAPLGAVERGVSARNQRLCGTRVVCSYRAWMMCHLS